MEPVAHRRSPRWGEPLLVIGLVGLFGGIVLADSATVSWDRLDVARSELSAMATRVCFLAIALAGTIMRARRNLRLRPVIALLGAGVLGLLAVEVHRVRSFDWVADEIPSAADAQIPAPIYALAVLAIVDLCWPRCELPPVEMRAAAIAAIRRIARAILAMATVAVAVLVGVELAPGRVDLALAAAAAAGIAILALLSGVFGLARHGTTVTSRWLAALGAVLLTWGGTVHVIHGVLMHRRFLDHAAVSPESLTALTDVAPAVTLLGLIVSVAAVGAMRRGSPEVVSIDRGPYLAVLWLVVAGACAAALQRSLLPDLEPWESSIPFVILLYTVPPTLVVPFLFETARDVERYDPPDLAAARVAGSVSR